ncbi:MAG: CDGSH iron-sulfur domain-containing protein [Candidatus Nitrosocosmicus sp.]|nr:CDGSH iron-sulfur domain-containing protein [Candidatus Nitrosocosmicus sp.]
MTTNLGINSKSIEKPKILPLPNGPLYLLNDTSPKPIDNLKNSKGETLSTVSGIALCRCRASNNKPFCDGTHSLIKFSTIDENKNTETTKEDNPSKKQQKKSYMGDKITSMIIENCVHMQRIVLKACLGFLISNKDHG